MQVHKFVNRNRDSLDPAVLEMLRQSQLQVTQLPFRGPSSSEGLVLDTWVEEWACAGFGV